MKISETTLPFLKNDCLQIFGQETGAAIFQRTETIYRELLQNTEQRRGKRTHAEEIVPAHGIL